MLGILSLNTFKGTKKKKKERKAFITKKQNKNKNVYSFKGFWLLYQFNGTAMQIEIAFSSDVNYDLRQDRLECLKGVVISRDEAVETVTLCKTTRKECD